jgi:hypothetical protein
MAGETLVYVQQEPGLSVSEVADRSWRLGAQLTEPGSLSGERHVALTNALGPRDRVAFERSAGVRAGALAMARALTTQSPAQTAVLDGGVTEALAAVAFGRGSAAVVCLDGLPQETWLQALNSGAHLDLARRLVTDAAFAGRARALIDAIVPPSERAALVAEWGRQSKEPLPPNIGPLGTAVAMIAGGTLLALWHYSHLSLPLVIPLGVLLLAGAVVSMFGGSGGANVMRARAEAALAALAAGGETASRRLAAVAILANAWDSRGPASSMVLDVPDLEARLGPALETVKAVERVLCAALLSPAVFTAPKS